MNEYLLGYLWISEYYRDRYVTLLRSYPITLSYLFEEENLSHILIPYGLIS